MKLLCIEVPRPTLSTNERPEVEISDTPPLQLLCLAMAAERAGWTVVLQPANSEWAVLLNASESGAAQMFVEHLAASQADAMVLMVNSFNWPLAARLLNYMASLPAATPRPRIVVAGAHATLFPHLIFSTRAVDAIVLDNYEEAAASLLATWQHADSNDEKAKQDAPAGVFFPDDDGERPSPVGNQCLTDSLAQLTKWHRWDYGLSTAETFGFTLERQLHPWNLPVSPAFDLAALRDWLYRCGEFLSALRKPQLWLSLPSGTWNREALDLLGSVALQSISQNRIAPLFAVRATADELLAPSVLASLAVLNVHEIELLVGTGVNHVLERYTDRYTLEQVERCMQELKRVGLAPKTRLSCVLGLPEESLSEALETVRYTMHLATENGCLGVKHEWWYNVPNSPLYRANSDWEEYLNDASQVWFLVDDLFKHLPAGMSVEERRVLMGTIELMRGMHTKTQISSPHIQ